MVVSDGQNSGWLEVAIDAAPELHDPLGAFFFDMGATGLVLEDFGNPTLKAYLPLQKSPEDIQTRIAIYFSQISFIHPHLPSPAFKLTRIENQDWQKNWRKFFRPVRVTPDLMILPVWENPQSHAKEKHLIRIDPGPAFGTGQHATTKMCLQAMEFFEARKRQTFLDVGTGSGILAIYGAMLGFGRIEAIDVDPEAVRWARQNIGINGVEKAISVSGTPVEDIRERFTLVCANLILGELLRLMPILSHLVESSGHLIISGILDDQVEQIENALPAVLAVTRTLHEGEWAAMVLGKNGE